MCVRVSQYVHMLNIQTALNNLLYHYTTDLLVPANTTKRFRDSVCWLSDKTAQTFAPRGHLLLAHGLVVLNRRMQRREEAWHVRAITSPARCTAGHPESSVQVACIRSASEFPKPSAPRKSGLQTEGRPTRNPDPSHETPKP